MSEIYCLVKINENYHVLPQSSIREDFDKNLCYAYHDKVWLKVRVIIWGTKSFLEKTMSGCFVKLNRCNDINPKKINKPTNETGIIGSNNDMNEEIMPTTARPNYINTSEKRDKKHFCLYCHKQYQAQVLDLKDLDVEQLANFMGHHEKIHKDHYRLPAAALDMGHMTRILDALTCEDVSIIKGKTVDNLQISEIEKNISNKDAQQTAEQNLTNHVINSVELKGHTGAEITFEKRNKQRESYNLKQTTNMDIQDNSGWSSSSESEKSINLKLKTKRKAPVSPYGKVRRRSWTTHEKSCMKNLFFDCLANKALPSLHAYANAINQKTELKRRTPMQLKAWVANQIKKAENPNKCRHTWVTPEKKIINNVFKRSFKMRQLPTLSECSETIQKYPELRAIKPAQLKAWINNQIRAKTEKYK